MKSTKSIDILSETLNSFHFFFFHKEIGKSSLEYMLANINKLIIFMMWILQSYNRSQTTSSSSQEEESESVTETLDQQNINDSFDFTGDSHVLKGLSKHTIGILKENIQKMIVYSPLMPRFLDQNCQNWKTDL
jgi:hypothetical protein